MIPDHQVANGYWACWCRRPRVFCDRRKRLGSLAHQLVQPLMVVGDFLYTEDIDHSGGYSFPYTSVWNARQSGSHVDELSDTNNM